MSKNRDTIPTGQFQIVTRCVTDLIPYARNARTHSDAQVAQIAASIKEFGFNNPILTRGDDVIAGHGRLLAARKLGLETVPTLDLAHLSKTQARAYILADNQLALTAGWDADVLRLELLELAEDGFNLDLLGFEDVNALTAEPAGGILPGTDEDAVPEAPAVPITKPGDLITLGRHRLLCGDATVITDVERLMEDDVARLVITDPPWNVAYGTNLANNAQGYKARTILNDSMDADKWAEFLGGFVGCMIAVTEPGCPIYCVMGPSEWPAIDKAIREGGFHWSSTIIWAKDQLVMSRKDYHTQYEPIWYGWKEGAARLQEVEDRKQSDLWTCDRPKASPLHPTTKPVELLERAINNSSKPGDIIFEPFAGSGSLLIAAEKTGRSSRNMELDPIYCDVIVTRWEQATGKKAVRP